MKIQRIQITCNISELVTSFISDRTRASDTKRLSASTVRIYQLALRSFQSALSSVSYEDELPAAIKIIVDAKLDPNQPKHMTEAGVNVYLRALNSFLTWCHSTGVLQQNVKMPLFKIKSRQRPRVLSNEESGLWNRLRADSLARLRAKYMVLTILDTGLRAEECLEVKEADIDWVESYIWVRSGKGGKQRQVPLSETGKRLLRHFLMLTYQHRETQVPEMIPDYSFVFCTNLGGKMSYRNSLRDLKRFGVRLGLPWVNWHTFRRTFGTMYLRNRGLLTDLQEIYGHQDVRTTLQYLGSSIKDIVKDHEQKSPLARTCAPRKKRILK